ncbi:DUF5908 family protein [Aureisphaera galaxeae]|uniref:DUF5908 family protein n=1 Tax=Aureisphaera galaxeae TaxID=1538023 RepID=UPI00235014EA|nr:DUF5908 family protein [Aureisphaera galaxeae]MDC8005351.1 DUF5908 family protein [Aureisphaera galaxeae]
MAIEIKELHIKVKVEDAPKKEVVYHNQQTVVNQEVMTAEIIKKCTRNVLEILKERQER